MNEPKSYEETKVLPCNKCGKATHIEEAIYCTRCGSELETKYQH